MKTKTNFYYTQLPNRKTKELYYKILCSVKEHRDTAEMTRTDFTNDEVMQVLYALDYDYPELFYVTFFGEGCYTMRTGRGDFQVKFRYLFSPEEQKKRIQENNAFIRYILSHLPEAEKMSGYRKALWLHDVLIQNIHYNYKAVESAGEEPDAYTVLGGMRDRKAVCSGISKLYQMLCEQEGIWCIYVHGRAEPERAGNGADSPGGLHAWNMIGVGQTYAHVDVTWDLQGEEKNMPLQHTYFGMSDEQCRRQRISEQRFPGIRLPACQDHNPLNYFIRENALIQSARELEQYISAALCGRKRLLSFQLDPRGVDRKLLAGRARTWLENYFSKHAAQVAVWTWRCHEAMLVFDIHITYRI